MNSMTVAGGPARTAFASKPPKQEAQLSFTVAALQPGTDRVFAGLSNGDLRVWQLDQPGQRKKAWQLVGQHR